MLICSLYKPMLIRGNYRRLCDGEAFFFVKLLELQAWRSDEEILSGATTYRARLMALSPALYASIYTNQRQAANTSRLAAEGLYLELVQFVSESVPQCLQHLVRQQLLQLNTMHISSDIHSATLELEGDQYKAYTAVTSSIQGSRHTGVHFFITGPGGTGKSFLLKALEAWCARSRQTPLLLAPTGIAANGISGRTIHSVLSLFSGGGVYKSSIFSGDPERANQLRKVQVLILDEVSMVDSELFGFISSIFSRLHEDQRPFGNIHVILFGDLMQLPPVSGLKVFNAPAWRLFHPLFLQEPQRQIHDRQFFDVLNKIRFGIVDSDVKEILQARALNFDLAAQTYLTTFLCSLRLNATAMNNLILSTLASSDAQEEVSIAVDCESGRRIEGGVGSKIFKRGTNFPETVTCMVGAKVMFLTNSMLDKGISNGTCGIITHLRGDGEADVAFPTREGIRVGISPSFRVKANMK